MKFVLRPLPAVALSLALIAGACAAPRASGLAAEGQVITADMIRGSGLRTGWDVLRRYADHLRVEDDGGLTARRGPETINGSEIPLLVIDGVRVSDFRALRAVPASDIQSMRILSALQATTRYGTRAANGAVEVATLRR